MAATTSAVHIPESLFHNLKRAADLTHRSVEDVTVTSLEAALPAVQNLSLDTANELAADAPLQRRGLVGRYCPFLLTD